MEKRVRQKLIHLGVRQGDRVGVAVSGGVDSMALLHCVCSLANEMNIVVSAYHMEHGIRGQSAVDDMDFVVNECAKLGVLCTAERADIPAISKQEGVSIETAARLARYAFLDKQCADYIATAHHMDDMAETVIMNLARGSGLCGLCGIPEARGRYIRPLLDISRQEIEQYVRQNNIAYVEDLTNDDTAYTRNYIRKEILPRLRRINGSASANIARTAKLLGEDEDALLHAAKSADCYDIRDDGVYIDIKKLIALKPAIQKRVVRMAISEKYGLEDIEQVHIDSVLVLAQKGEAAKRIDLGRGMVAAVVYDKMMIGKEPSKRYNNPLMTFSGTGRYCIGDTVFECSEFCGTPKFANGVEYFDADVIEGAAFRYRLEADYISPLGLGGTKRMSDYLSDRKIPLHKRDGLILLVKGSEVFWVAGVGVSEKSKIKKNSRILKIRYWEK
ncbi:MAG: tRNA lysidine(34) synthetase TilS [Eubacteriales bacterium]|nr:tRNA lysidine(34) synthetase TilS [Eubacteriales bacterium]